MWPCFLRRLETDVQRPQPTLFPSRGLNSLLPLLLTLARWLWELLGPRLCLPVLCWVNEFWVKVTSFLTPSLWPWCKEVAPKAFNLVPSGRIALMVSSLGRPSQTFRRGKDLSAPGVHFGVGSVGEIFIYCWNLIRGNPQMLKALRKHTPNVIMWQNNI